MDPLDLTFLFKDNTSGAGGCPAFYAAGGGDFVVQGKNLPAGTALRDRAADESGVRIPGNIVDQIVAARLEGRI